MKNVRKWNKKSAEIALDLPSLTQDISNPSRESPLACFEKEFPRERVEHIVEQTIQYSLQKGRNVNVTIYEVLGIIGLMVYSGYKSVLGKEMWSNDFFVIFTGRQDFSESRRSLL